MASTETQGADPHAVRANKLDLLERMADDLAHEIKNPLHSMVINLEVLKRRIARLGDGGGELMHYAEVLAGELERVNRRVELLLRLVRPGRSGEPATLGEVVAELIELVEMERERRDGELRFAPADYLIAPTLPRDATRQLVLNFLLEGLDHLSAGDTLVVRTELEGGWERLRLGWEGDGASSASARHAWGSVPGNSLAMARSLAEALGGQIEDHSGASGPLSWVLSLPVSPA